MKKKLDKVTRAMVRRAVLYLLDKYNIPYEVPVTTQNAVQIASQLYAEGILTADMLVEINLSSEMLSELTLSSSLDSSPNLILNTVTGATAAYSLRQINANYTGPLIRVRRDAQEFDIGASNLELNTTYLQSLITQGENYLRYSENFSFWTVAGLTMAENQPFLNGINTARTFYPTATTGLHRIVSTSTNFLFNSQYIPSGYIKSLGHRFIQIGIGTQQNIPDVSLRFVTVDTIERKIITDSANGSGRIELLNDGWFRVWFTIPPAGVASSNNYTINLLDSSFSASYTGDPTKGIAFYGAQINTVGIQPYTPIVDTNTTTGTNIFVTTIYDQSGNNYNLAQTVAANQPQIVINGAINRVNGKPAILFDGVNDTFRTLFSIGNTMTRFMVMSHLSPQNNDDIVLDDGISADAAYLLFPSATTLRIYNPGGTVNYSGVANNVQFATYNLFNGTSGQISVNNIAPVSGSIGNITYNGVTVGSRGGATPGYHANFHFQELIMYNSNQSANRQTVMNNINQHYQIYWDGSQQSLLDQYPNAAAAYSLRNLSTTYTGPLVRVRRATDSVELDIYGKYDGTLDTQSLTSFCSATNGFVRNWYDQSSNNRHTIATTNEQPVIVNGGLIQIINNKPSALFTNDKLTFNYTQSINQLSVYIVGQATAGTFISVVKTPSVKGDFVIRSNTDFIRLFDNDTDTDALTILETNAQVLRSFFWDGSVPANSNTLPLINALVNYYNSTLSSNQAFDSNYAATGVGLSLGFDPGANTFLIGSLQEVIFYDTDTRSNRIPIESNINSFYQIY